MELVYTMGCPYVAESRAALCRALKSVGVPVAWREWRRDDPDIPAALRGFGSPTVVVNGRPVGADEVAADVDRCRLYPSDNGHLCGAPSVELIRRVMQAEVVKWPRE